MNENPRKIKNVALPLIKNYSSRKEWEVACWQKILKSDDLLNLLTTSNERHDLIMRAAAINGLMSGKSYREISKEFFVSLQTISVVKKALAENIYKSYLTRSRTERKKKIYSPGPKRIPKREWHEGRPQKTKYGTIYMPY